MSASYPYASTKVLLPATSTVTSLARAIATKSCTYVRNPRFPVSPIATCLVIGVVFRRAAGSCARATARSIDADVANRCAACMKVSASCSLSVFSACRSNPAIRVRSLSSRIQIRLDRLPFGSTPRRISRIP
ncbi:Uncharacterised protein [Mycobacteroides abscessus subsp. abscessus]|nr:Uncharacterised protein [Mycobacteroides abscessus subsp. abscessus]